MYDINKGMHTWNTLLTKDFIRVMAFPPSRRVVEKSLNPRDNSLLINILMYNYIFSIKNGSH